MLRIKLVKSKIGHNPRNRATLVALGLRKTQAVVYKPDTPSIRGMIHPVKELLQVDVVDASEVPAPKAAKPAAKPVEAPAPVAEAKPKRTRKKAEETE